MHMVSGSSSGMARALTPVRSSSMRIMVGSSCPSMSSFRRLSSMQWYSKWVVMVSAVGVVRRVLHRGRSPPCPCRPGTTTRPPGCWPVVRRDAHAAQGQAVHPPPRQAVMPFSSRYFFTIAEGGLFRQRTDGARPEHLGLSEHLDGVAGGPGPDTRRRSSGRYPAPCRRRSPGRSQRGCRSRP